MANKQKYQKEMLNEILNSYDSGETPANLAVKWGVHPTTIRRWLRQHGRELSKPSHPTTLNREVKTQLKKVLVGHKIVNIDALISDLDEHFQIELKKEEEDPDFPIINV